LFVRPDEDPRFNLAVGAIFAAVASEYIVSACLPATHVVTLADALHMLAFGFIFVTIAESIVSLHFYRFGDDRRVMLSRRLDRWSLVVLGTAFVITSAWLVVVFAAK
jgi:hypothetical protein